MNRVELIVLTLAFATCLLGKALADLRGPVSRKAVLTESGIILVLIVLVMGWVFYDQDPPHTGLAAIVYSESTLAERREAERLGHAFAVLAVEAVEAQEAYSSE